MRQVRSVRNDKAAERVKDGGELTGLVDAQGSPKKAKKKLRFACAWHLADLAHSPTRITRVVRMRHSV